MKRAKLVTYLKNQGCYLSREGANHSIFVNPQLGTISAVPRHSEVQDILAYKICKDLGIPKMKDHK